MLRLTLALVVVAYLPGARGRTGCLAARAHTATGCPSAERAFWAVLLSVIWSVLVVLLLGAVGQYSFDRLLIVNGAVSAAGIALGAWRRPRTAPDRQLASLALPLVIIAIGWWLYFPAVGVHHRRQGPGHLHQRGHPDRAARPCDRARSGRWPKSRRPCAICSSRRTSARDYYGLRFMGFFIQDPADGTVVGQFPHFYPASIAIGYGARRSDGRPQHDRRSGRSSACWRCTSPARRCSVAPRQQRRRCCSRSTSSTLWFARYPNSELPMQALIFAAVLAALRARDGGGHFFAVAAGALLGLTLLLRYEVLIAMAAVAAVAVLGAGQPAALRLEFHDGARPLGRHRPLVPPRSDARLLVVPARLHPRSWRMAARGTARSSAAFAVRRLVAIDAIRARVETMLPPALALTTGRPGRLRLLLPAGRRPHGAR